MGCCKKVASRRPAEKRKGGLVIVCYKHGTPTGFWAAWAVRRCGKTAGVREQKAQTQGELIEPGMMQWRAGFSPLQRKQWGVVGEIRCGSAIVM